jgi:xylulokinase
MMENPLLLGIDIGTSACKVALFAPDGTAAAQAHGAYAVFHPAPGWAEQNPDDWWHAVCGATKAMLEEYAIDPHRIAGIGIDGQSWSAIPVSKDGASLCNTQIWMDTRAAAICEELDAQIGAEKIFAVCGNPLQPTYTLPKILWYKRERPSVYEKADKMLQSNAYIVYKLTGEISQDSCQAFGLHVFDTRKGTWDDALCKEMGLRRSLLAEPVPCHTIVGNVTADAAKLCGLCAGIPVVAGGLDAACGALGAGVLHHGQTQEQGGQAGGMSICLERCHAQESLILSRHVVPDRWLLQGGTVGGGGIMRWLQGELWPTLSMRELDEEAAQVTPGSDGLVFLPYMAGERSPIWDAKATGVFFGLDYQKTRGHMIRASLEGAAFALRHNLEVAESAGAQVERLRAMGGAANSRLWTQIKADITGKTIDVPSSDTATTLGAAMLAGVATGVYNSFEDAVAATVTITRTHEPQQHTAYDRNYRNYRELYENLKDLMRNGANT